MSYKNIYNLYNESVAGKSYQRSKETLLLELTINEASIKRFAYQYMEQIIELDETNPEHKPYLTNPYNLSKMMLEYCKERGISLNYDNVNVYVKDSERIQGRKYRKVFKDFAYLVGDIAWRQQVEADRELARYLLALEVFEPGLWGDEEDEGMGVNQSDRLKIIAESNNRKAHMWTFLPYQRSKTQMRIRLRMLDEHEIASNVMKIFNKRQKMLQNKDIFAYPSFFELVKTLATTRSKSELKKVGADIENSIKEIKAAIVPNSDPTLLIIKPPSHAFSKKYFGFTRYSIRDILAISDRADKDPANREQILSEVSNLHKIDGATWCTAANGDKHWNQYIVNDKTELYYLINLEADPAEELYAIRVLGSYLNLATLNNPLNEKQLQDLQKQMNEELGPGLNKGSHFAELALTNDKVPNYGRWSRITPLDGISTFLNYLYYKDFKMFVRTAIVEMRDRSNHLLYLNDIASIINLDNIKKHLNLITGIPSMSQPEIEKVTYDICMQKREASSNNVNQELVNKFKLK